MKTTIKVPLTQKEFNEGKSFVINNTTYFRTQLTTLSACITAKDNNIDFERNVLTMEDEHTAYHYIMSKRISFTFKFKKG